MLSSEGRKVIAVWIGLSIVATPLVAFFAPRFYAPGNGSVQASDQVIDNTVITAILTPVICLLVVFFAYVLSAHRAPKGQELRDGPALRSDATVQAIWVSLSAVTVLFLAGFGTYELLQNGSGGGQGPSPIAKPGGTKIPVQVIAQQWQFTYRYPTYGGVETPQLVLPADTYIELHVTSLDAIHSFWAYQLGVKADANPGVDNIAYVKTTKVSTFDIRCAELCGLWHGYMSDTGHIVSASDFASWIAARQKQFQPVQKYLPPYAPSYAPDPTFRAG